MNLFNILLLYFKACEDKTLLYTFLIPHANTDIHYNCMIPCYVNVKKKNPQNIKAWCQEYIWKKLGILKFNITVCLFHIKLYNVKYNNRVQHKSCTVTHHDIKTNKKECYKRTYSYFTVFIQSVVFTFKYNERHFAMTCTNVLSKISSQLKYKLSKVRLNLLSDLFQDTLKVK